MSLRKKILSIFLSTVILFSLSPSAFAYDLLAQSVKESTLATGIVLKNYSLLTSSGWITANVVEADMTNDNYKFNVLTSDNGVQNLVNTKVLAAQNNALAAVNGDFFAWASGSAKGSSIGTVIKNGEVISTPAATDSMVSFYQSTDGILQAGSIGFVINFFAPNGDALRVYTLNKYSDLTEPAIYDRNFGTQYVSSYPNIIKVFVEDGTVTQITSEQGTFTIPENGYILAALADKTDFIGTHLAVGDKVTEAVTFFPDLSTINTAIGAGTMLVKNGSAAPITHGDNGRNPRTAIGTDKTGTKLYLITVDGRSSASVGMTLKELQSFMIGIGVASGANLDGGGSTTLVARPYGEADITVRNNVSDKSLRAVTNAAAIVPKYETSALAKLNLTCNQQYVFNNTSAVLWANGMDSHENPVNIEVSQVVFSSENGSFDNNIFKPSNAGKAIINGNLGGAAGNMELNVLDTPSSLTIHPTVIDLTSADTANVTITGKDANGYSAQIYLSDLQVELDQGCATADGLSNLKKTGSANGILKVSLGGATAYAQVKTNASSSLPPLPDNVFIADPKKTQGGEGYKFAVFGSLNNNTIIQHLMAKRAITALSDADLVTFIGNTDPALTSKLGGKVFSANNYSITYTDNSAFIILNNRTNGLKTSSASQWPWLTEKLGTIGHKNLFIMLPNELYGGFTDKRELDLFIETLEKEVEKGRNVYLFAPDTFTNSQRMNGIRYITTNGIYSDYSSNMVTKLENTKYVLVTITDDNVTYEFKDLY